MPRPMPPPPVVEPQQELPLGHVSAVHAMTTPPPPSAPQALALATHIISSQHTSGGLHTAAPHGTGPPVTTGPPSGEVVPPLLEPDDPPEPEELIEPLPDPPPSPELSLLVEPPQATARAIPVPSDTAIPILIRMKASLPGVPVISPRRGARPRKAGRGLFGPYVAPSLQMGSRRRRLTIVAPYEKTP